jgi:hypothetical protein
LTVPGDRTIRVVRRRRQDLVAVPAHSLTWSGTKLRGVKKSTCRHQFLGVGGVRAAARYRLRLRTVTMAAVRVGEGKQGDRAGHPINTFSLWSHLWACRNISPIRSNIDFSFFGERSVNRHSNCLFSPLLRFLFGGSLQSFFSWIGRCESIGRDFIPATSRVLLR